MVASDRDEDAGLRAAALTNAQSILVARRRAEEALRQQSEWLLLTLASIGDAVISTDAEGRVTSMNAVAQALTGWSQADADFEGCGRELVHDPAMLPLVKSAGSSALIQGARSEMVFPLGRADGVFRRCLTRVNPVRDSSGDVEHWFGTNTPTSVFHVRLG